jgi:hypothetical protein
MDSMKGFMSALAIIGAALFTSQISLPAAATPLSAGAFAGESVPGGIEFVRRHRHRGWRGSGRTSGVPVFIVPGIYWGPAWWDPNYSRNRSRRNCNNWFFAC